LAGTPGIIVQARLTSKRFPNKMLARINGKPLILYTLDRLIPTTIPIIVAIPSNTSNDGLAWVLEENGYIVFRGFEDDVLDRFLTCAKKFKIDPIIRICGDSSMISDKEVVETLQRFNNSPKQWLTIGLGVQIF